MVKKIWFITGTSRGFGRQWTEAALKRGDYVADTARDPEHLKPLAETYGDATEETNEALQKVVRDGKARYLGFSEWTPEQIQAAIDIGGPDLFVSSQPQYSMLWQAPEAKVFPICEANGISQIVWSPLAQGILTGKYQPGQPLPADSRAANDSMNASMDLVMSNEALEAVQRLVPIAEAAGLTMPEMSLASVLRRRELPAV